MRHCVCFFFLFTIPTSSSLLWVCLSFIPATSDMMFLHTPPPPPLRHQGYVGGGDSPVFIFPRSLSKSWLHVWWVEENISDWHISLLSSTSQQVQGCSVSTCQSKCVQTRTHVCKHTGKDGWQELCGAFSSSPQSAALHLKAWTDSEWNLLTPRCYTAAFELNTRRNACIHEYMHVLPRCFELPSYIRQGTNLSDHNLLWIHSYWKVSLNYQIYCKFFKKSNLVFVHYCYRRTGTTSCGLSGCAASLAEVSEKGQTDPHHPLHGEFRLFVRRCCHAEELRQKNAFIPAAIRLLNEQLWF